MNPNLCRVALRPRSPFEVFDLTLRFVRTRARPLAKLAALVVLPVWGLCMVLAASTESAWVPIVAAVLLAPLVQAPFTLLGGRLLFSEEASVLGTLRATWRVVGGLLIAILFELLSWAVTCTGFGLVALPALVYLPETALLERVDLGRGLQRSVRLASGQVGVAVMAAVSRWGLMLWGALVGELGGQALVGFVLQLGTPFGTLLEGFATPYVLLGILLSHPLYAIYRLLLYVDVRTRMEGWDLQVGLRALGMQADDGEAA